MRNTTFFAIFCVALVTVLAIPTPNSPAVLPSSNNGIRRHRALSEEAKLVIALRMLSLQEYTPLDWLTDVINAILGVGVGELLTTINTSLNRLSSLITLGVTELQAVMAAVDPKIKQEIQDIINVALVKSLADIRPIMDQLGLVLPQITFRMKAQASTMDAADIIFALLGISLEEFLTTVARGLENSDILLTDTVNQLFAIADKVSNPDVASALHDIIDECLRAGKAVIRPVLDSLYQVLPSSNKIATKGQAALVSRNGIFAKIMSTVLGFDVLEAGIQLEITLIELEHILESYVRRVDDVLINSRNGREEANEIINKSIKGIRDTVRPISNVFLPFVRESVDGQDINKAIVGSILGVSLESFLMYVDFATNRIEEIVTEIVDGTEKVADKVGHNALFAMRKLNEKALEDAEQVVSPLLAIIDQILPGDRKWVGPEEFLNHIELVKSSYGNPATKIFCDFSLIRGHNADFIINVISAVLEFDLVEAVTVLDTSLDGLEILLRSASGELNYVVGPNSRMEVTQIIQKAINDSQITIQPVLDVLVQFLPNPARHTKDVMNSIIEAISGIDFDEFVNYMQFAAGQFEVLVSNAVLDVKLAVADEGADVISSVDIILEKTTKSAETLVQPFLTIIAPTLVDHNRGSANKFRRALNHRLIH